MNVRATVVALPVVVGLLAASASASPVILSPLGAAPHPQVATVGGNSCAAAATPAQLTQPSLQYPAIARLLNIEGVASVGVSLSAAGRPTHAWLIGSTGNAHLDRAALETALNSKYVAEEVQCSPVSGDYKIEVEFALP